MRLTTVASSTIVVPFGAAVIVYDGDGAPIDQQSPQVTFFFSSSNSTATYRLATGS
jgi:hypothetical protein